VTSSADQFEPPQPSEPGHFFALYAKASKRLRPQGQLSLRIVLENFVRLQADWLTELCVGASDSGPEHTDAFAPAGYAGQRRPGGRPHRHATKVQVQEFLTLFVLHCIRVVLASFR
jgi:hypothetical protein